MPPSVKSFQPTPNPNALKCVLEGRLDVAPSPKPRSYARPQDAADDPLARALLAIPGVTNVLIHPDWITINRAPDAEWAPIKAAVTRALRDADQALEPPTPPTPP